MRALKFFVIALCASLSSCMVQPRASHRAKLKHKHYTKPMKGYTKTPIIVTKPSKK